MSRLNWVLFFLSFFYYVQAQEIEKENYLWPVEGKNAGENILYCPQDYVDGEHNFDNLFIAAENGTNIVCPCDGIILGFGYSCRMSINISKSYHVEGTLKAVADSCRKDMAKNGIDAKFLAASVYIQAIDGRKIKIEGLDTGNKKFITGQRVKRGEVLGKIHYCYKKIPQHCIMLNISTREKPSDPMAPFGLKSTFIPPVVQQSKQRLTRAEAIADYRQLAAGVKEIYPSLEDFMSEAEYDSFVEREIAKIPESISLIDFARLVMNFNHRVHDSHMWFLYGVNIDRHKDVKYPPLQFGKIDGQVKVIFTTVQYREYLGREIVRINGKSVDTICAELGKYFNLIYDADVQSVTEQELAVGLFRYYYIMAEGAQKDNRTTFTFADGEDLTVQLENAQCVMSQYEYMNSPIPPTAPQYSVQSKGNFYSSVVNESTAYIRLKTFSLMDTELEQMLVFIGLLQTRGIENLIIDLRNNPGGYPHVVYKMVKAVMDEPIIHEGGYQKVNAQTFSGTQNLVGEPMFNEFKQMEGKKGFYSYIRDESVENDSARHDVYRGRIYVLINGGSASASTTFAGIMKRNKRGYIVGRETKTAYHYMNAVKFADIQLINSLFRCHIPMVRLVHDEFVSDEFPYGRGVIPHMTIPISYEELTANNQLIYTKTLSLIENGVYLEDEVKQSAECHSWIYVKDHWKYLFIAFLLVMVLGCVVHYRYNTR